jgi:uncharacterized protein YihD (DUF1040 family)
VGKMKKRNPNRRQKLLNLIWKRWERNPNQTLMNMLINITIVNGWNINDLSKLEDSDLIKMFNNRYTPKDAKLIE